MRRIVIALVVLGLLAACGSANVPTATVTVAPVSTPTPQAGQKMPGIEQQTIVALAGLLGLKPEEIKLSAVEEIDWPSAGLGCPAANVRYAQVITPGYRISAEAGGQKYEIQTNKDGTSIVLCQNGTPTPLVSLDPAGGTEPDLATRVAAALAAHLKVDIALVNVVSDRNVDWPDGSLGCPDPAALYIAQITPGHQFELKVNDAPYAVHTNADASMIVLCENGKPTTIGDGTGVSTGGLAGGDVMLEAAPVIAIATSMLAQELGVDPTTITVQGVEAVEWPTSGLGCEKDGQAYLQVITPGYNIVLEHQTKRYEFHSDMNTTVVRCDR